MPKNSIHIEASTRKIGQPHEAVHEFVDFEPKKPERHDVTRMVDYSKLMESKYGTEAVAEEERIKLPVFCEHPGHNHSLWNDIFCPGRSCDVNEPSKLP
jgi:hypothetical protein